MPINPSTLSGLRLWLRAKDLGAGGSSVLSWPDQSGRGHNATAFDTAPTVAAGSTPSGGKSVAFSAGYFTIPSPMLGGTITGAVASSEASSSFAAAKAFDGDRATCWASATSTGTLRFTAPAGAVAATSYSVMAYNAPAQAPAAWTFQGSNDGSSWTTLDTKSGQTFVAFEQKTFTFVNSTAWTYYRINVTANAGAPNLAIGELSIDDHGLPDAAEMWIVVKANAGNQGSPIDLSRESLESYYPYAGVVYDGFGGTRQSFTPTVAVTSWRLFRATRNASTRQWFLDNASQLSVSAGALVWAGTGAIGGAVSPSSLVAYFGGNIAEILVRGKVSSSAEAADLISYFNSEHGLSVPGGSSGSNYAVDGAADAVSAADGAVSLKGAADGAVAGVSASDGAVTVRALLDGQVDGVSSAAGTLSTDVNYQVSGQVDAVAGVEGDLGIAQNVDGQVDAGSAVEGDPGVAIGFDGQVSAVTGAQGTIVVPTLNEAEFTADSVLDVAPLIDTGSMLGVAEFTATSTLDVGTLFAIEASEGIEFTADSWLRVIDELDVAIDPVTRRPQYKLVAVDMYGTPIAELDTAAMGTATRSLNGRGGFEFRLGKTDPKLPYVPQYAEVQLWRGRNLVPGGWFVITDPAIGEGDDSFDHQCAGLAWYFEARRVGMERPELLRNGGFEQGSKYWGFSYSPGSNAETPPKWEITDDSCEGGKALRVFADDKVVEFKRTVETQGVFVANSSTFLPGGEQFIRDAIADIPQKQAVTIEGHTADADGGTGYALSVARAEAAKTVAHAARPDLVITAVGKGETEQVASNATEAGRRKNRRVVIRANFTATKVGHRQFVGQSFTYTNDTDEPLEFDIQAQGRIDTWGGPSKDGWMLYADVRTIAAKPKILNNGYTNVDEFTVRNRWVPLHTTVEVPANTTATVNVRGYPTAGASSFDQFSAMPNLKLTFNQKDPQQVICGLVAHAQDPAFGKSNLNIQGFGNWSGFKIDRSYPWKEHIRVSDAIDEVVRSLNGPDANMLVTARRRWLVVSPKQGHETGIVLAAGNRIGDARILGYESGVDGDEVATTAIVQSSWSGGGMSEVFARKGRTDGLVLERLYQAEQDAPTSTLREQAGTAVEYGRAGLITKVTMHPDDTTFLMSRVTIGDVVTVDVHDSQVQVRADHRIIQIDLDPNVDQLTYTLAPKE